MGDPGQQILKFPRTPSYAAADFLWAPCNEAARTWLGQTENWPNRQLALWGQAGNGKTHLLHIWAERSSAVLWRGPELHGLPELPAHGGIALDEADEAEAETALLHLLNAASEAGLPVLLAGRTPPTRWPVHLPDLASRLRAITAVEVLPPDEEMLRALLGRLFVESQLVVPLPVHEWLFRRLPRTPTALREAVARLDEAALVKGTAITRTLAAATLADMIGQAAD